MLAAVGAIAALATECTVEIERNATAAKPAAPKSTTTRKKRRSTGKRS
jgi:hypothetical protein